MLHKKLNIIWHSLRNFILFNKKTLLMININIIETKIWGLGIGDWGLGIGDWAQSPIPQSPIPNPQSPIPNPQSPI